MKLSDSIETAIHCTLAIAALPDGAVMPASALAQGHGVSASYLVKTLKQLVAAGVLSSVPGPAGGYRLARPLQGLTLRDVVQAIEGTGPAFRCREIRRNGPCAHLDKGAFPRPCGIRTAMLAAEEAYLQALGHSLLSDLMSEHQATSDPRVLDAAERFTRDHMRPGKR